MAPMMGAIGMGATLIGAGVKAFGDYSAAASKGAMYTTEATDAAERAQAYRIAAETTDYAGGRAVQGVGLQYRAAIGRMAVGYGAGNIAGRTTGDVRSSQLALAQQSERETMAKYGELSYQERIKAATQQAASQRYALAAGQARREGTLAVASDILAGLGGTAGQAAKASEVTAGPSVAGDSSSVAPKWAQVSDLNIGSGDTTGPPLDILG